MFITGARMSCTAASNEGSSVSSCQATLRRTDLERVELNRVVGKSGCWLENWSASLLIGTPYCLQSARASRNRRRSSAVAGCQSGASRPLKRPLPNGEPLMMPIPFCRASGSNSSARVSFQRVVIMQQAGINRQVAEDAIGEQNW